MFKNYILANPTTEDELIMDTLASDHCFKNHTQNVLKKTNKRILHLVVFDKTYQHFRFLR